MAGCCAGRVTHEPRAVRLSARAGFLVRNRNVGAPFLLWDARPAGRLSGQIFAVAGPCRTGAALSASEVDVRSPDGPADAAVFFLAGLWQLYGADVCHTPSGRLAGRQSPGPALYRLDR